MDTYAVQIAFLERGLDKRAWVLPAALGIGTGAGIGTYLLSGKIDALKKQKALRVLLGLVAGGTAGVWSGVGLAALRDKIQDYKDRRKPPLEADPDTGRAIVESIMRGQILRSCSLGQNDAGPYTGDAREFLDRLPTVVYNSLWNKPCDGYLSEISLKPGETTYDNDYVITAYPAPGYVGPTFQISKDGGIEELND